MNAGKVKISQLETTEVFISTIIDCIQDIKGKNIVKLDLRNLEDRPADFFIICEGESSTQVRSIAGNIKKRIKDEMELAPFRMEGLVGANWIVVDYFDTLVHVFYKETRSFYELEDLWGDAQITSYEDIV